MLTLKEKRDLAQSYFLSTSMSQQVIAARVGVSENTLTKWKQDGGWEVMKGVRTATRNEIITSLYQQIALIQQATRDPETGKMRVMTSAETQQIRMLTKAVAEMDKKLAIDTYMQVVEEYMTDLFDIDSIEAKRQMPFTDRFMDRKFKELGG